MYEISFKYTKMQKNVPRTDRKKVAESHTLTLTKSTHFNLLQITDDYHLTEYENVKYDMF